MRICNFRHVDSYTLSRLQANQSLVFLHNANLLSGETANTIVYSLWFDLSVDRPHDQRQPLHPPLHHRETVSLLSLTQPAPPKCNTVS